MELENKKKRMTFLMTITCVLCFQASFMKPTGPLTTAVKMGGLLVAAGCSVAGGLLWMEIYGNGKNRK